jgi:AcrR family transcriptional regulator
MASMRPALTQQAIDSSRGRLTEIATKLFLTEGEAALSLRRLAAAAGMSRSTPYSYFTSKQDILDSIRAAGFDRLTLRCATAIAQAKGPLAQMRELGRAVVRFACDEPDVYRLMFGGPVFTDNISPVLSGAVTRFRTVSRPPLEEAIRQRLVLGDAHALRRMTWAAFHGLILLHLHGHLDSEQLEGDFETLNQMIGHGILAEHVRKAARRRRQ